MATVRLLLFLTALCITQWIPSAHAQFAQDYDFTQIKFIAGEPQKVYTFTPVPGDPPIEVIDIYPRSVVLIYNCYYMTAICKNAHNFQYLTARGKNPHPNSGIPSDWYGYDFNTADGGRRDRRRDRSCPANWKNTHNCPEVSQQTVFRHDGPWWTTETMPINGQPSFYIRDQPVPYGIKRSQIQYSCDEFPPATWVEGGGGLDDSGRSETRCAAIRCQGKGVTRQRYEVQRTLAAAPVRMAVLLRPPVTAVRHPRP
ncbi:hypothetical protein F5Y14DRAFT_431327 [Nemania sp. NC0429]|nr:hypothetical protein F5Y14DRAFT_431327 [Nemania sp. NC0429]